MQRTCDSWAGAWLVVPLAVAMLTVGCGGCASQQSDEPDRPPTEVEGGSLIGQLRGPDESKDEYRPPTSDEYIRVSGLLGEFYPRLLAGATDFADMRPRFRKAGFRLRTLERDGESWVVLYEGGETWRGTGTYVFRTGREAAPVLLQAPHSYYDIHTGEIVEKLFEETEARAFFFNSLHRYRGARHERVGGTAYPSDLAHDTSSFFHLFMTEYLIHRPDTLVAQFHGYADGELEDRDIGVVLSNGSEEPTPFTGRLADGLGAVLEDWEVAIYPDDTDKYAATANIQGRWIRRYGRGHFVHVEFIDELRDQLEGGEVDIEGVGEVVIEAGPKARE